MATDADPLRSGPRTVVIMYLNLLWGLWRQLRLWPDTTHVYMPTEPTVAKARPISAAGTLVVHSDVRQVLN